MISNQASVLCATINTQNTRCFVSVIRAFVSIGISTNSVSLSHLNVKPISRKKHVNSSDQYNNLDRASSKIINLNSFNDFCGLECCGMLSHSNQIHIEFTLKFHY